MRLVGCAALVVACVQGSVGRSSGIVRLSEEECEAAYDGLMEEHQRAIRDWAARVEDARGTERFEELRQEGAGITSSFLPRFEELAARDCGLAKLEVLDLLGHIEPHEDGRVDYAIGLLEDLVRENTDAWWIAGLGDDDVMRYFLLGSRRERAIELLDEFVQRTEDEEARRGVLFELSFGRILNPGGIGDREAALRGLDEVVGRWPGSQEAERARGLLFFERELQVGQVMPVLEGRDVDGREVSLGDQRGKVVVVDFFGFWCVPCREGLPVLKSLVARHAGEDLALLGVDAHDDEETFRRERERLGLSWPCIFDGSEARLSRSVGVTVFPAVFVVDREGVIRARNPGEDELRRVVEELVRGE